jgi:hypothetical protein
MHRHPEVRRRRSRQASKGDGDIKQSSFEARKSLHLRMTIPFDVLI